MTPDNKFPAKVYPKNALNNEKLTMWAPSPNAPGRNARLEYSLMENCPRITVFTGDPSESSKENNFGKIYGAMDPQSFYIFMTLLEQAANSKEEFKTKIENKGYTFFGGKRSETPVVLSETIVGRDKDGIVWMSVVSPNRPRIKFPFSISEFHTIVRGDGSQPTAPEISSMVAKATVKILQSLYPLVMSKEYVDTYALRKAKKEAKTGGYGGGYNSGQSGGGNKPAGGGFDDNEDSIPF